jgi:hypothetical protein
MAVWPPELQQYLNEESFTRVKQDTNITTQVETGPVKKRRRFTNPQIYLNATIWVHKDDYTVLEDWYDNGLSNGTDTFDFVDPPTGRIETFRFVAPFTTVPLGGVYYQVSMQWESIP